MNRSMSTLGALFYCNGMPSDCVRKLRPHVAAISTLNLLFWFIDAVAQ